MKKIIIAIDGYSSSGKSSFARAIAREMNYIYIDSGAMYRAVTLYCLRKGYVGNDFLKTADIISDLREINIGFAYNPDISGYETFLNSENVETQIRGVEVSSYVSRISLIPEVRSRMVELQREIGRERGIVMDGRDIGTVVFPEADLKLFIIADIDVRTERRWMELQAKGVNIALDEVKANLLLRDTIDSTREDSPLKQSVDATVIDTSYLTPKEQLQIALDLSRSIIGKI